MRRKGLNVALTVVIAFVLAALVLAVSTFLLEDGLSNLDTFFKTNTDIGFGLS